MRPAYSPSIQIQQARNEGVKDRFILVAILRDGDERYRDDVNRVG